MIIAKRPRRYGNGASWVLADRSGKASGPATAWQVAVAWREVGVVLNGVGSRSQADYL